MTWRTIRGTHADAITAIRSTQLEERLHGLTEDLAEFSLLTYYLTEDLIYAQAHNGLHLDPAKHLETEAKAGVLYNRILLRLDPDPKTGKALSDLRGSTNLGQWEQLNQTLMGAARDQFAAQRKALTTGP